MRDKFFPDKIIQIFGSQNKQMAFVSEARLKGGLFVFYLIIGRIPPLLSEAKVGDGYRIFFTLKFAFLLALYDKK